jgi:hypothetical protein
MKRLYSLVLFSLNLLICCASPVKTELNGVWMLQGKGRLTHISEFSWGKNPVGIEYTAIDLDNQPPMAYTEYGGFIISELKEVGDMYVLEGSWADGPRGEIEIGVIDKNTIWFESMTPHSNADLGRENFYCRVPVDAKVDSIDPQIGP